MSANSANYATRQTVAEETASQLIHSWAEYGGTPVSDLPLDQFPNVTLRTIAEAVGEASQRGIRGWGNVLSTAFIDAPEAIRSAFTGCCQVVAFPPSPEHCGPAVSKLRDFHIEKRERELGSIIARKIESGDSIEAELAELATIKAGAKTGDLASLLSERIFDFGNCPVKPIPILSLCGMPICTPGNLTNIQGPVKSGKSAVEEAIMAAAMNGNRQGSDTLGFVAENPKGFALLHFDTEQSRFDHDALVRRALRRARVTEPPAWFASYSTADLDIGQRRRAIRHAMVKAQESHGGIFAVMIDGIGDLCADPNDPEEAFDLVHELHALTITYDCAIVTVLHENPGSESGKTRGHLGSQLERKAETNLRLAKDKDGVTTMWADRARHCYLPKEKGPCFSWNDSEEMHTSCGTAGEIKTAANREKLQSDAASAFNGTESFRHSDLMAAVGEAFDLKERAAKDRVRKWAFEGIIRKDSAGNYHLSNP
jgi:hypothetical protein